MRKCVSRRPVILGEKTRARRLRILSGWSLLADFSQMIPVAGAYRTGRASRPGQRGCPKGFRRYLFMVVIALPLFTASAKPNRRRRSTETSANAMKCAPRRSTPPRLIATALPSRTRRCSMGSRPGWMQKWKCYLGSHQCGQAQSLQIELVEANRLVEEKVVKGLCPQ